jgi:hypothetical protein
MKYKLFYLFTITTMTTLGESLSKTTQKQLKAKFPELAEERKGNIQEVLNS